MNKNNINIEQLEKTKEKLTDKPGKAQKTKAVEGEWKFDGPQFSTTVHYEKGEETLKVDMPSPMGGEGRAPGPMKYCLLGSASCFATTFMSIATERNIEIDSFTIRAENHVDMRKTLDITDEPIVKGVSFIMDIESDADDKELQRIKDKTRERCPGVYCLENPIDLDIQLK